MYTLSFQEFYVKLTRAFRILKINSENGARYMRLAIKLLDTNMALLDEAKGISQSQYVLNGTTDPGNHSAGNYTADSPTSIFQVSSPSAHVSLTQFPLEAPYFPSNLDTVASMDPGAESSEFDFGLGSTGDWY